MHVFLDSVNSVFCGGFKNRTQCPPLVQGAYRLKENGRYINNREACDRAVGALSSDGGSQQRFTLRWMDLMKCDIWVDLKVVRIGQMEPKLGRVQCPMASGTEA